MRPPLEILERDPRELAIELAGLEPLLTRLGPLAVVDLETTGLSDDPAAEILELGFVLIDPGSPVLRTLHALVRPSRPLPLPIQRLTGLRDADLAGAAALADVAGDAARALTGRALVAHNAGFERDFLSRFVDPKLGEALYLDTQDLLALTHPDAPDLRLESFTRLLLGREERHRALEDALDTARVLSRVAAEARSADARYTIARRAIERFAPESPWASLFGAELVTEEPEPASPYVAIAPTREEPVPFDEDAIAAALADGERARRYLPGYRVRREQIALARHFARTLREGGCAFVEGGTGVGKSLAYLAAAIPFALERAARGERDPLVISTRTKLLQDQLLRKDIPAAAALLGHPELLALSIKGRANYVCERRTAAVLAEGGERSMFFEDRFAFAVLMACARTRPHGEIGAIPGALVRRYPPLRDLLRRAVAARAEQCSREECARHPQCPFGRRRAALAKAHLVVANHDLLLRWPPDYPRFRHAIADEAHELAGVADEVYAMALRPDELIERIDEIFGRPSDPVGGEALLSRRSRRRVERDARAWRRSLHRELTQLGAVLAERAGEYDEVQLPPHAERILPEAAALAESAAARLEQVAEEAESLDEVRAGDGPGAVQGAAAELRTAARALRLAFHARPDEAVAAFENVTSPFDRWRLAIRPVSPAEAFHRDFLFELESFAAVSASLFVGDDPFAALGELEIEERAPAPVQRVSVESPFPYAEHMRVVALDEGGDLVEETASVIAQLARRLGGRTLGLFTSLRRMNQVAEILARELRDDGIEILAPRRASDDPAALVERFQRAGGGVLLGARTFWQGLDIPGRDLQAVVIEKLPFEVPTELRKRREARLRAAGLDAFQRHSLGKMLLYLKQMCGRLIRSEEDRGVVVIVEGRAQRSYFASLAKALPSGVAVRVVRPDDLPAVLAEIGLAEAPADSLP